MVFLAAGKWWDVLKRMSSQKKSTLVTNKAGNVLKAFHHLLNVSWSIGVARIWTVTMDDGLLIGLGCYR